MALIAAHLDAEIIMVVTVYSLLFPHLLGSRFPPEPLWRPPGVTNQWQVHLNTDNHPAQCERSQSDSLRAKRNAKGFALASQAQNPTLTITQTLI